MRTEDIQSCSALTSFTIPEMLEGNSSCGICCLRAMIFALFLSIMEICLEADLTPHSFWLLCYFFLKGIFLTLTLMDGPDHKITRSARNQGREPQSSSWMWSRIIIMIATNPK